jgi:ribosomal protein S18 acetylase RimI-like enzyme
MMKALLRSWLPAAAISRLLSAAAYAQTSTSTSTIAGIVRDQSAASWPMLNRCWSPYFPDEPLVTPAAFKRSIRDLQVWCSSCMVAFSGSDPIGVLIGAKRPSGTLIQKIAVHPDHRRQGQGRHLLASLGSKLAILGPPRPAPLPWLARFPLLA